MAKVVLDVRERDEFEAQHIERSINVPLSHFASVAPGVLSQLQDCEVLIMCRSGKRAKLAESEMRKLGFSDTVKSTVFEGGILEWSRLGKPTVTRKGRHLPIMRQVQLVSGVFVLTGTLLGAFVNPWFLGVSGFFGAGLTFAGVTGFCGMAQLLEKMPWNRVPISAQEEVCVRL